MMFIEKNNTLEKDFEFKNFTQALSFVNKVWDLAEELNHHPDIVLHWYNKVKILLFTHSEDKITDKDYKLAQKIENIYNK